MPFNPTIEQIIAEAAEIAGTDPQTLPEHFHTSAHNSLNLLLADITNYPNPPQFLLNLGEIAITPPETDQYARYPISLYRGENGRYMQVDESNPPDDALRTEIAFIKAVSIIDEDAPVPRFAVNPLTFEEWNEYPNINPMRPTMYFYKQSKVPELWMLPKPDKAYKAEFIFMKTPDAIMSSLDELEIPTKWMNCLTTGLAVKMCLKLSGGLERYQILKAEYAEAMNLVLSNVDDGVPIEFDHNIFNFEGGYR